MDKKARTFDVIDHEPHIYIYTPTSPVDIKGGAEKRLPFHAKFYLPLNQGTRIKKFGFLRGIGSAKKPVDLKWV